jgi:hypothetical protein
VLNTTSQALHLATAQALLAARGPSFLSASDDMSYQVAPRAKIFRRDSGRCDDSVMVGVTLLAQHNFFECSESEPWLAIEHLSIINT